MRATASLAGRFGECGSHSAFAAADRFGSRCSISHVTKVTSTLPSLRRGRWVRRPRAAGDLDSHRKVDVATGQGLQHRSNDVRPPLVRRTEC